MLKSVVMENTTACGANCIVCVRDRLTFPIGNMDFELFQKAIREIVELYASIGDGSRLENVEYGGMGDPLLDTGLEQKMAWIAEGYPQIKQHLCTTGHMLGQTMDVVCQYADTLKISNYGFSKQTYEKVHGGSLKYEIIKENLDKLLALGRIKRPKCIMSYLVVPENETEMEEWKEYYKDKCDEMYIWKPHNWTGYVRSDTVRDRAAAKSCGRPGRDFTVRANGDVTFCCWDFNRQMPIGNIRNETFRDIFYGKKLEEIKEMHRTGDFWSSDNICRNCDQLYDRKDALLYSSNDEFRVGKTTMVKEEMK